MDVRPHTLLIHVRDYECDMQGIVNNAVYQNYLEHARHAFLKDRGLDFAEITQSGIHLVVMRAEIDYRSPLKSGMTAIIETQCKPISRFKTEFRQKISIESEETILSASARFIIASISESGRPTLLKSIDLLFD
ncbi:acyl-CoA thioesterase [Marinomonas ostreistagni]|uniref:Acyl-CoA thioesterase n=1 Tax=Marinomonas ostreistagni TaxID=359209 RepID=A0ABS0Z6X5_9GAMM|nr:acyl-CoA thioesterase [Marinomonas ostreistagni]MBJ7549417.1 acyl-CoA thioesterase [Marinomonas ostreistagni]